MIRALAALALLALPACATVNKGTHDYLRVDSVPQGASVSFAVDPKEGPGTERRVATCAPTPCAIRLPRRARGVATITAPGYEPFSFYVGPGRKGGVAGTVGGNALVTSGTFAYGALLTSSVFATLTDVAVVAGSGGAATSSTSSTAFLPELAGSLAGPTLAVTALAITTDLATGANATLAPNPVVIGLAPTGTAVTPDLNVPLYYERERIKAVASVRCEPERRRSQTAFTRCKRETRERLTAQSEVVADIERRARALAARAAGEAAPSP